MNMTRKSLLVLSLLLLGSWSPLFPQHTAHACSPATVTNYWYRIRYEVDTSMLPADIEVELLPAHRERELGLPQILIHNNRVDESIWLMIDGRSADEIDVAQVDYHEQLSPHNWENESDEVLRIAPVQELRAPLADSDDFEAQHRYDQILRGVRGMIFDTYLKPTLAENPQTAGGIQSPPPEPTETTLLLIISDQLVQVPVTTYYEINRSYQHDRLVPPDITLAEKVYVAKNIVAGTVIGSADEEYSFVEDDGSMLIGSVIVEVDWWLKGEVGSQYITIASFGYGSDCRPRIDIGSKAIFLLQEQGEPDSYSLIASYGWYGLELEPYNQSKIDEIVELVGQEPAPPIPSDPPPTLTPTPTDTPPPTATEELKVKATPTPELEPVKEKSSGALPRTAVVAYVGIGVSAIGLGAFVLWWRPRLRE